MEELPASLQKVLFQPGSKRPKKRKNTPNPNQSSKRVIFFSGLVNAQVMKKTGFKSRIKTCLTPCVKSLALLPM